MFGAYAVGLVPALLVSGPVPGVVAADLVLVLADLALGALEGLLNGPAGDDRTRLKISAAVVTRTASRRRARRSPGPRPRPALRLAQTCPRTRPRPRSSAAANGSRRPSRYRSPVGRS